MGQTHYPSKSWVFERRFSFKVRQHGKKQLSLQYKVCWIYKMVGAPYFSQTYLYILSTKSPSKINSSISANFYIPIPPYLFTKPSLRSQLTLAFSILQQFFTSLFLRTAIPAIPTPKTFSLTQPWESLDDRLCFNLSLLPWSWTGTKELTITDSLSLRLSKLMYCRS